MKRLFFGLLGLTVLLSACGDDDEVTQIQLSGLYEAVSIERVNCTDTDFQGKIDFRCPEFCLTYDFKGNGQIEVIYTDNGNSETTTGTYSIDNNQFTGCSDGICETQTFEVSGNILTLNSITKEEDSGCDIILTLEKV